MIDLNEVMEQHIAQRKDVLYYHPEWDRIEEFTVTDTLEKLDSRVRERGWIYIGNVAPEENFK